MFIIVVVNCILGGGGDRGGVVAGLIGSCIVISCVFSDLRDYCGAN